MKKKEVLAIKGLSDEQKAAAERWFNSGLNKGKEMEGDDEKEIKAYLKKKAEDYAKKQAKKEKEGTLKQVQELVQSLCKGHKGADGKMTLKMFTYNEIIDIIKAATDEVVAKKKQLQELLEWNKERNKKIRG